MKKLLIIPFLILFTLIISACQKPQDNFENSTFKIIVPAGTPQLALSLIDENRFNITQTNGPDLISSSFASKEFDLIVAPTNLGLKLHNNNYQLLATIIWGSLYIVGTGEINPYLNNIHKIYTFGKGTTNDILLTYVIDQLNLTIDVSYLASAEDVRAHLLTNPNDIVVLPEPQVSIVENVSGIHLNKVDLSLLFNSISNHTTPQASIFIKSSLKYSFKNKIHQSLETSINKINDDYQTTTLEAIRRGSNINAMVLMSSLPNMNIHYLRGSSIIEEIAAYWDLIHSMNEALVGVLPGNDFYF
ncbi:MAG: hypothetical protein LBV55_00745 [Acholeplasmatales bacterium]|jgi:hypothetical protein|nr:hypothetical protein [Acholeplasmatales bacterium]